MNKLSDSGQADATEIEVTPAMVVAGVCEARESSLGDIEGMVYAVYVAMQTERISYTPK